MCVTKHTRCHNQFYQSISIPSSDKFNYFGNTLQMKVSSTNMLKYKIRYLMFTASFELLSHRSKRNAILFWFIAFNLNVAPHCHSVSIVMHNSSYTRRDRDNTHSTLKPAINPASNFKLLRNVKTTRKVQADGSCTYCLQVWLQLFAICHSSIKYRAT